MSKNLILFLLINTLAYNLLAQNKKIEIDQLYNEGKYTETIELANNKQASDSVNFTTWYYKGLAEQALYKYSDAVVSFEKAASLTQNKTAVLFLLGNALESSGDDVKAIETYKELIAVDSMYIPAKARLAHVYKSQKEYLPAIEMFSSLVKLDSSNSYFYKQLAFCCNKFGFNEPVISYYEKAIALNPNDLESGRLLINEFINQKYYEDAIRLVDSFLIRFPNNIDLLKQQAYISAIGGNYLDAVRQFQKVVELGDSSLFTSKYYGQSLYNNGQYDKAIFWLNRYIKTNEDDTKNHYILGMAYQKDYQYTKSLEHFHTAMGQVFDKQLIARVFIETGNTYSSYGDYLGFRDNTGLQAPSMYKLAIENYLLAIDLTPTDFNINKILGKLYEEKLKDQQVALYYFEKYYKELDTSKIDEWELSWIQQKITALKEEIHFMGK